MSQAALAREWQVSTNTVRSWETNQKAVNTLIKFVQLCQVLSCSPHDLVTVATPSSPEPRNKTLQEIRQSVLATSGLEKTCQEIRVAELRKAKGLTQQDIAHALEVSLTTIQNWENNRTGTKQLPQLIKLCEILNCKHTDLLDFIPPLKRTEANNLSEIQQRFNQKAIDKTDLEFPTKPSNHLEVIEEK